MKRSKKLVALACIGMVAVGVYAGLVKNISGTVASGATEVIDLAGVRPGVVGYLSSLMVDFDAAATGRLKVGIVAPGSTNFLFQRDLTGATNVTFLAEGQAWMYATEDIHIINDTDQGASYRGSIAQ